MQAGALRQIITLQTPTESVATDGQRSFSYATSIVLWASVKNRSQDKSTAGDVQAAGVEGYMVRMRYRDDVTYDSRIIYDGKTLQIVGIENENERNRELRIECEVVEQ